MALLCLDWIGLTVRFSLFHFCAWAWLGIYLVVLVSFVVVFVVVLACPCGVSASLHFLGEFARVDPSLDDTLAVVLRPAVGAPSHRAVLHRVLHDAMPAPQAHAVAAPQAELNVLVGDVQLLQAQGTRVIAVVPRSRRHGGRNLRGESPTAMPMPNDDDGQ